LSHFVILVNISEVHFFFLNKTNRLEPSSIYDGTFCGKIWLDLSGIQ
jgi:hypothetical protein